MKRLSIIDLQTGQQPISNEDGTVWIVFNGELYNYLELRDELTVRGHRFRTRSDTEVLVHLYEEEGDGFLSRINAMASLALWDGRRRRLLLARDRLGKKPLHYALTREALVFESEIKALLRHPAVRPGVDASSVARYLVHDYVPCPRTIYEGIAKLRPGHLAVFQDGNLHERPYWDIPGPEPASSLPGEGRRGRGGPRDALRRGAPEDDLRRPPGRVPFGRARLQLNRGLHGTGGARPGAHLLGGIRGSQFRRVGALPCGGASLSARRMSNAR